MSRKTGRLPMFKKKNELSTLCVPAQKGNDVIIIAKKVNIASNAENLSALKNNRNANV
jgi:hypothetical protein